MIAGLCASVGALYFIVAALFGAQAIHSGRIFHKPIPDRVTYVVLFLCGFGSGWLILGIIELGKAVRA